ncbi:hypothetical protein [Paenibacillus taiwanensis]|uniref:hypothetical protein n=1 Tax=Paenibacillus taiwanensis TaxID=401638 RepID=UPI000407493E|nr:hypothetical protein [Paenibacillus taiwanensis]
MCNDIIELLIPGSLPNVIVRNKITKELVVLFSVHHREDVILLGPITKRDTKEWLEKCWTVNKKALINEYETL